MSKMSQKTRTLTQLAMLTAIIAVMAFTPLGYLKTGGLSITFIMIPVVVGAIVLGPSAGAFLGGVFGITSFIQCFGLEPFGSTLLTINPFTTFIVCMVPRIIMGWLAGVIFKAIEKHDKTKIFASAAAGIAGPLLNTIFFMGLLVLFFYNTEFIVGIKDALGAKNVFAFVALFVGVNGIIEAVVSFVITTILAKPLLKLNARTMTQKEAVEAEPTETTEA